MKTNYDCQRRAPAFARRMKAASIGGALLLLLLGVSWAEEKQEILANAVGTKVVIIGNLGVPVGKVVTIAGSKVREGPGDRQFRVTSVDGQKINMRIEVEGIKNWPDGTEATLKGAEVGTLKMLTLEMTNYGPNDPRWKGAQQHLFLEFKVEKIVTPIHLRLDKD